MTHRTKVPHLAKILPPRLHGAVARERLFACLDEALAQCKGIFVAAPPGAGKSTLAASWIEDRCLESVWLQVDGGDTDLPSFYHHLGLAARTLMSKRRPSLPVLTPEYRFDLSAFNRRYWRQLFTQLPASTVLVFDNCHEVPPDHAWHRLLSEAVDEMSPGMFVVLISRHEPPGAFARHVANANLRSLGWDELALTPEETDRMVRSRAPGQVFDPHDLHARCGGWMVGLTLLLENAKRGVVAAGEVSEDRLQRVFDYLAAEVFDRFPAQDQQALLPLSLLPVMTLRAAERLSGQRECGRLLDALSRRRLFTERLSGRSRAYQFHALFRAFLFQRYAEHASERQLSRGYKLAGRLLEADGEVIAAFHAYRSAADWAACVRLILAHAEMLLVEGRWAVLADWCQALPERVLARHVWVRHWLGTAWTPVDPVRARGVLVSAYEDALAAGDAACALQCAAGVVEGILLLYSDFSQLDRWIAPLEAALDEMAGRKESRAELRVLTALLTALHTRCPEHPRLHECVDVVLRHVETVADVPSKLLALVEVSRHGTNNGHFALARLAVDRMVPWVNDTSVSPLLRGIVGTACLGSTTWMPMPTGAITRWPS